MGMHASWRSTSFTLARAVALHHAHSAERMATSMVLGMHTEQTCRARQLAQAGGLQRCARMPSCLAMPAVEPMQAACPASRTPHMCRLPVAGGQCIGAHLVAQAAAARVDHDAHLRLNEASRLAVLCGGRNQGSQGTVTTPAAQGREKPCGLQRAWPRRVMPMVAAAASS